MQVATGVPPPDTVVPVQDLVILTGPIAAGKSTVADLLAERCAADGRSVAAADLDEVAFAQHGTSDLGSFWQRAGIAHTALVRGWLSAGIDVVVAHGPLFESGTYDSLAAMAGTEVRVHQILLLVPVEVALERVAADPDRPPSALSRQPDFVRSASDAFAAQARPAAGRVFDTAELTAAEIAGSLAEQIGDRTD